MGEAADLSRRSARRSIYLGAAAAAAAAVVVRWILFGSGVDPVVSPDTSRYVEFANAWRTTGQLPPVSLRLPGYPLLLLWTAGAAANFHVTMFVQHALGVLSTVLLYALTVRLTGRVWLGLVATGIALLLIDIELMELVLYTETLTLALVTTGALSLALGLTLRQAQGRPEPSRGATCSGQVWWLTLSGLAWTGAAFTRPVHLAALGVFVVILLVEYGRGRLRRWALVPAALLPVALIVSYMVANGARDGTGRVRFVTSGYHVLNYLAYPALYRNLPPEMADVQQIYLAKAPTAARELVWSWYTVDDLVKLHAAKYGPTAEDDVAVSTALQAIRARPLIAAGIWKDTLGRYLFTYDLLHGLLINNQRPPTPDNIQVAPAVYRTARVLESSWQVLTPILSLAAILMPLVAVWLKGPRAPGLMAVWLVLVTVVLANVTSEPFSRQARFRIPVQYVMISLALAGAQAVAAGYRLRRRTDR